MALMVSKSLSLVEQKRLQWQREREELAGLCAPWGPPTNRDSRDVFRSSIRTHFLSSTELRQSNDSLHTQSYSENMARMRRRSPSLPPIYNRCMPPAQEDEITRIAEPEDEGEEETSGYASESGGNERHADFWREHHEVQNREPTWEGQQMLRRPKQPPWPPANRGYMTPDSVVSTPPHRWSCGPGDEAMRPRWGDRGVGVGHLWEPTFHEPDCRLPQVQGSERGTPSWLERGLSKLSDSQVLVINHASEPSPSLNRELAGSCDTINTQAQTDCGRTFIRGQNVPLEPEVLLERERKRQKALEHQNAIRQQLEERDRKRKEERERRIREEKEEEERIKREQDRERERLEDEQRRQKEKEDKEVRKAKAMCEALENAEKLARQEKIRTSRKHILEFRQEDERGVCVPYEPEDVQSWFQAKPLSEAGDIIVGKPPGTAESAVIVNMGTIKSSPGTDARSEAVLMPADGLAVVLGSTADSGAHDMLSTPGGGVQLALLMSPSSVTANLLESRLLTPSKYRQHGRECGTQTDSEGIGSRMGRSKTKRDASSLRKDRKKSASLDRPHRGCKLPLRCRSQSQPGQQRVSLEDRPKWGVNRPGTQYMKQSEKDPYYQRRLRQRLLRAAMLNGGGDTGTESDTGSRRRQRHRHGSSEDNSRSPSPQQNSYDSNRRSLFYRQQPKHSERTGDRADLSIISLDLSTLDSLDNEQIMSNSKRDSMEKNLNYQCGTPSKRVQVVVPSQNVSQRLLDNTSRRKATLLQSNGTIQIPRHLSLKGGGAQRLLNRKTQPPATIDKKTHPNLEQWSSHDILSQLTSLRQGLLVKQQEWETQRSQTPYSESSWHS